MFFAGTINIHGYLGPCYFYRYMYMKYVHWYLYLQFKYGHEIRQITHSQTLMNFHSSGCFHS